MKLKQTPEDFRVNEITGIAKGDTGRYTYFFLHKRNYTTLRALDQVAEALRIPRKRLSCAGNKDKVAVTCQVCSAEDVAPEALKALALKDIRAEPIGKGDRPVSLGRLDGNAFVIVVRDIDALPPAKTTFINLFGEQRFSTNNAAIGKAIVKRDFKTAIALILATKSEAAEKVHKILAAEPKNYLTALKQLPLKLLKLYVHAYESLLWNEMALEYAKTNTKNVELPIVGFGTEPGPGLTAILQREGVTTRDFVIKELPELSSEGTWRAVFADAAMFTMGALENDELNPGKKKVTLTFILPPGSYATEFVRQLFIPIL